MPLKLMTSRRDALRSAERTKKECDEIHSKKTVICDASAKNIFKNLSYLFEPRQSDGLTLYKRLKHDVENADSMEDFSRIYETDIGEIYQKVTGHTFEGCTYLDKIKHANKFVRDAAGCIQYRILYHNNCIEHSTNYDIASHQHEILFCVFLYRLVVKVKALLNLFRKKCRIYRKQKKKVLKKKGVALNNEELILGERIAMIQKQRDDIEKQFSDIVRQFKEQLRQKDSELAEMNSKMEKVREQKERLQSESSSIDYFRSSSTISDTTSSGSELMSPDVLAQPFSTNRKTKKRTKRKTEKQR